MGKARLRREKATRRIAPQRVRAERSRQPRRSRRWTLQTMALGVAVVVGVVILFSLAIITEANHNWITVATVNGVSIDRGTLRDRVAFEEFLYQEQVAAISKASAAGRLDATDAASDDAELSQALGDPVETARSDLVDETLTAELARTAGVTADAPADPWTALASYIQDGFRRDLLWIDFAPTTEPTSGPPGDAIARAQSELRSGTAASTVAKDVAVTGWMISGGDRWIGMIGPADGLDDGFLAAARSASAGDLLGPITTRPGDTLVGYLASVAADDADSAPSLAADGQSAKIDSATVAAWARANTLESALRKKLLAGWLTSPARQVRGQEFVVGPSDVSGTPGPWVDLVALDTASLPAADLPVPLPVPVATPPLPVATAVVGTLAPGASDLSAPPTAQVVGSGPADAIASWLRAQPAGARLGDVLNLAAAANANGATDATRSGELGYLTESQIVAGVGAAAFVPGRTSGDVIGPFDVGGHPVLFYVEGRYGGDLDDRSVGALTELGAPGADPGRLAATFAPNRASLATDSGWWSIVEFASGDATADALFGTPIGQLSDPVALDGDLALFRPEAMRTALPDPAISARLDVEGYATWFAAARSAAVIVLAANPLPEAYPSATPAASLPPTIAPLPTPVIPGLPGATGPSSTVNPFAPPTLPGGLPGLPSLGP